MNKKFLSQQFQKMLTKYKELQMQIEKEKKIRMNPKIGKKMLLSNLFGTTPIEEMPKNWPIEKFYEYQKNKEDKFKAQAHVIDMSGLQTYKLVPESKENPLNPENTAQNLEGFYSQDFDSLKEELANFQNLKNYELLTTSEDCLKYPLLQPKHKAGMVPVPLQLQSRKVRNCNDCKKFIVKPDQSHTHVTDFKLAFFLYEFSPLMQIRKKFYNKMTDELQVIIVMENESEQYTMNVQLDNLEEDYEQAQIHNFVESDYYTLIILKKDRVQMKFVDFLDVTRPQSSSSTTQHLFEFVLKFKQDKPSDIDLKVKLHFSN